MDPTARTCSAKGTLSAMDDIEDYISLSDDFEIFESLQTHVTSGDCIIPRAVGNSGLEDLCDNKNLITVVTA